MSQPQLSDRERQFLEGAARGLNSAQIGAELFLSTDTVKSHAHRAFRKLGVHDRTAAVVRALQLGVITIQGIEVAKRPGPVAPCHPQRDGASVLLRADDHDAALLASAWASGGSGRAPIELVHNRALDALRRLTGTTS